MCLCGLAFVLFVLLSRREQFPDRVPGPLSVWDIERDTQNMPYPNLHPVQLS